MNLLFTAPITQPLGRPTLSGVTITSVNIDPDTLTVRVDVIPIEDPASRVYTASFTVTGSTTIAGMLPMIKAAFATKYGVTFQ